MKAELINSMGDDLTVVNAARVSFDKEGKWEYEEIGNPWEDRYEVVRTLSAKDEKLINYLASHNHFTPFTHCRETFISNNDGYIVDVNFMSETDRAGLVIDPRWPAKARNSLYGWAHLIKNEFINFDIANDICYHLHDKYPVSAKALEIPYGENNKIASIFEKGEDNPAFIDITLRETIPIFVARQRFKHMVGFTYNEVSRRYVDDTPEFFVPDVWRSKPVNAKQGSGEDVVTELLFENEYSSQPIEESYEDLIEFCRATYETMIKAGVAPEQARMVLPQSMYTSYYVTGSLYAFARAYRLRSDPHAQKEIQELATMWNEIIAPLYPVSWGALSS